MTIIQKQELILKVMNLLNDIIDTDDIDINTSFNRSEDTPVEMLTIKECAAAVSGLTESTVRKLVTQDKIPYIRTGTGKNGKILISKKGLLEYLKIKTYN